MHAVWHLVPSYCSPNSPLSRFIVTRAEWHLVQSCWNHMASKSPDGSANHSQLRYDSLHVCRRTVQWCHQPINRTKLWLFQDALVVFAMLLADLPYKIDNSTYLRIQWAKNELRLWTQFFDKEVNLRPTFQDPIHQEFCVAIDRSGSIPTPAVF